MKIVMLVPSLENRGPVIVAKDIADNTIDNNIEYIFISIRKNSEEVRKKFSKYRVYELNLGKIPVLSFELNKILNKIQPDIIHCHCFWPTVLAGIYLKKYKIISTLHNNPKEDYLYAYGSFLSKLMTNVMLFCQKKFNYNIAISNYIKNIHDKMGLNNVKVIYNGISLFKKEVKEKKYNSSEVLKLVTISELIKIKNVYFLINIIEKLKQRNIFINLKIIGDGKEKENIKKIIRLKKLENEIELIGRIPKEKVYGYLEESDIFLFSSLSEGFGLVIVEAMNCGIPVVVGDIPVMKELIINHKNGIISSLNEEEYIKAVLEIKDNLKEYKENIITYFNKNFYASEMSKNYIKIYEKMIKGD